MRQYESIALALLQFERGWGLKKVDHNQDSGVASPSGVRLPSIQPDTFVFFPWTNRNTFSLWTRNVSERSYELILIPV